MDRGAVYQARGDFDSAITDFSRAIELDPKYANAFFNRANAYRAKDDLQKAKEDLETALKLDPQLLPAKHALDEVDALIAKSEARAPAAPVSRPAGAPSTISFDLWTFALQTINFAILVWLLHRFLYKPVLRRIDSRRAELDALRAEAAGAEMEAKDRLAAIDAERAGIAAERAAALKTAAAQAEEAAVARRAQAERDAAALLGEARKTLAVERDQALAESRTAALDLGMGVARRLLAEVPIELRAEAWLTRIEQHLAGLSDAERAELSIGMNRGGTLRVVTAMPLPDPVASEWRARLHRTFGQNFAISFDVDDALVGGAELHFPQAVLRFSWRSALAAMWAEIETHGNAF
jgi:F-type H+-transporting ATPase subunit b